MTAEEARDYEFNSSLISDTDLQLYNEIMRAVSQEVSAEEPKRHILWRKSLPRKVRMKLQQDHFDVTNPEPAVYNISWEQPGIES